MNNSITVVIPLYNKEDTVLRCLNSIGRQKILPNEVIIIDDGSTDKSLSRVREWINLNPKINIILISRENKGVSYTRNEGVSLARNKYVAFLDSDDEWRVDFLSCMINVIDQGRDFSLISCVHGVKDSQLGYFIPKQSFTDQEISYIDDYLSLARNYSIVNSSKVVVNKKYFEEIGGFHAEAKVGEDILLWIQLSQMSCVVFINKNLVTIHQQADNSRVFRKGVVPYPIVYFSLYPKNTRKNDALMRLLWRVHVKHILGSLATDTYEAHIRFRYGFRLFRYKNMTLLFLFLVPKFIWIEIRKIQRVRLVIRNEE